MSHRSDHHRPTRLAIILDLHRTPLCPVCADPLRNYSVHVRDGIAMCWDCARWPSPHHHRVAWLFEQQEFQPHLLTSCGITFYSPKTISKMNAQALCAEVNPKLLNTGPVNYLGTMTDESPCDDDTVEVKHAPAQTDDPA